MDPALEALVQYGTTYNDMLLDSTSCEVVIFEGILYNVKGSSDDPRLGGSWKQLLMNYGIRGSCYVSAPLPKVGESHHPDFAVGGHMTPNPRGRVETGGICYLMPLCHWHNNTSRNGTPFQHRNNRMLMLHGYMKGEFFGSFISRLNDDSAGTLISIEGDSLVVTKLDDRQIDTLEISEPERLQSPRLLFRRVIDQGRLRFRISAAGPTP
jgi:hypothetical protein